MASTWAEALRDPHIPIHWCLVLLGQVTTGATGALYRFADAPLNIDGLHFQGALEMETNPGVYVDPYTSQSNSPNAIVAIHPLPDYPTTGGALRPYDLEATLRLNFLGWRARLYRWAEGTPWTGTGRGDGEQLVLSGYIHEPVLDADGVLHLTIVDRILRHNCKLPRKYITTERWNNPYTEDLGQGYPILYGTSYRIPAPVTDTTALHGHVLAAEGRLSSLTNVRKDDSVAAGAAIDAIIVADNKGTPVTIIDVAGTPGDGRYDFNAVGYADVADSEIGTPAGYFTGTAAAVITHPADQMHHLMRRFVNVREEDIDIPSFVQMRADLPGYTSDIQITSESSTDFFAIKDDVCSLFRSACFAEGGLFRMRFLDFRRAPVMTLRENETILDVEPIRTSDRSQLITKLVIRYSWRWMLKRKTMDFARSYELDEEDDAGFAANAHLLRGDSNSAVERHRFIETKVIQEPATAELVGAKLAELHGKPRKMLKMTVARDAGHVLRIFDVVRVWLSTYPSTDGEGAQGVRYVVTGITYGTDDDKLQLLEC